MTFAAFALIGLVVAVAGAGLVAVLASRNRTKRNRVVPEVETKAPASWAGTHTPEARLHRRLRDAVTAARAVADPDGALISARVEVERAAVEVDEHLVALAALPERERSSRMPDAAAAVASVESAAATLGDIRRRSGTGGALPAVEAALTHAHLVAEAREELDADERRRVLGAELPLPPAETASGSPIVRIQTDTPTEDERPRPMPG